MVQNHYFRPKPDAPHDYREVAVEFGGRIFRLLTDSHVFSRGAIDYGTERLLRTVLREEPDRPQRVLDLGTGIGVMGTVLASLRPSFQVVMSDISPRAVALAEKNAKSVGCAHAVVCLSDGLRDLKGRFDMVVLNPPIRAGKAVCYRLYEEVAQALELDGRFYLVIRTKQGAASTKKKLDTLFSAVERIDRSKGYGVYVATTPMR